MMLDALPGLVGTPSGQCTFEVTNWEPTETIQYRVPITATFKSTCGVNIDITSIKVFLNDSPVTPVVSGSGSEITVTYTPVIPLKNDIYTVTVRGQDVNGQTAEKMWVFELLYWY
jgi:hypothetical protein